MKSPDPVPYRATLDEYQQQADALLDGLKPADDSAEWRFKWMHPRFRGRSVTEVENATLDGSDAQVVIAQEYGFDSWADLAEYSHAVTRDGPVGRFEAAAEAVVSGDLAALRAMLRENPGLVSARSTRRHHATLLHYIAANGVEIGRQKTPGNAVEIAKSLLDAGAGVDALAEMYDKQCTTMSMLVSSSHPAVAGLQTKLAEVLIDYGAAFDGPGSAWQSAVLTALTFGYLRTAEALVLRGAPLDNLAVAAGLGRLETAARLLPSADGPARHIALAPAAQHGHAGVVRLLLDAGGEPDRYNPEGYHAHATPLHHAALSNHADVVRLFVERGARLDIRDTIYRGTPLDWAIHGGSEATGRYLRDRDSTTQ